MPIRTFETSSAVDAPRCASTRYEAWCPAEVKARFRVARSNTPYQSDSSMPPCLSMGNISFKCAAARAGSFMSTPGTERWRNTFITETACIAAPVPWPVTSRR